MVTEKERRQVAPKYQFGGVVCLIFYFSAELYIIRVSGNQGSLPIRNRNSRSRVPVYISKIHICLRPCKGLTKDVRETAKTSEAIRELTEQGLGRPVVNPKNALANTKQKLIGQLSLLDEPDETKEGV